MLVLIAFGLGVAAGHYLLPKVIEKALELKAKF